jgi:hypothetical protein
MNQKNLILGGINIFYFSGYHDVSPYDCVVLVTLMEYVVKLYDVRNTEYFHKGIYYTYMTICIKMYRLG